MAPRPPTCRSACLPGARNGFDEQYQNQRDVIGSPPVAKIEPGQKQLVRLTRTGKCRRGRSWPIASSLTKSPRRCRCPRRRRARTQRRRFASRCVIRCRCLPTAPAWSKDDATRQRDPKGAGKPQLSWQRSTWQGATSRCATRAPCMRGSPMRHSNRAGRRGRWWTVARLCAAGREHALAGAGRRIGRPAVAGAGQRRAATGEPGAQAIAVM